MAQGNNETLNPASKDDVLKGMHQMLKALQDKDSKTTAALNQADVPSELSTEERRQAAIKKLMDSIKNVEEESQPQGHAFHSREDAAGIIQSSFEANVMPELQGFSEGNPIVWIPAGIKGILEHLNGKFPFQKATKASRIEIPNKCKIALLGDWGADNDHAKNVAAQAMTYNPDYVIHLGDIYYSGSSSECETFLKNWPLKGEDGKPAKAKSFALNGNHEMYSLGKPYFTMVLPAFGQEASYFTLYNEHWQFQGLDTAYVPFSISGGCVDDRLKVQWDWLKQSITENPAKRNILLSHNQPVSAHLSELVAAQALMNEARQLLQETRLGAIYGWFFGHEHRCTVYRDDVTSALFRARLIGNGAIGHHPQEEAEPAKDESGAACAPWKWVNRRSFEDKGVVAISSFALLTIDEERIHVEYIDEDGVVGYEEAWLAGDQIGVGTKSS
ncbi:metallophosphoesterase family protein [Granulicella cerasi]|uniref:Metallophosphoesterase family protein n=1 Tax=Granulicella cerasi TaxID=741063 RepID=A0ABW1ZC18_9BACT|nr:metallophosphoesterase [Granulicella cerasi]